MKKSLYDLIDQNKRRTYLFILIFTLILAFLGYVVVNMFDLGIAGYSLFAAIIVIYNLSVYYHSDRIALSSVHARAADPEQYKVLHNVVEEMAIAGGVPKPQVYVIDDPSPNAFATGRNPNHAKIAVTKGLLDMMNRDELQGVVAHEISHVRGYDILLMTVVGILGGLIILLRDFLLRWGIFFAGGRRRKAGGGGVLALVGIILAIVAPLLVLLIRSAISREREYRADADGAYLTRYPDGLASALEKMRDQTGKLRRRSDATAHLFIASPFGKDRRSVRSAFASHPPLDQRISRLRSMGSGLHYSQ
jgi:heat shock protein HtpX